jgi:hypothetical protein
MELHTNILKTKELVNCSGIHETDRPLPNHEEEEEEKEEELTTRNVSR